MSNQPLGDLERIQEGMRDRGIGTVLALSQSNMWALSGYPLSFGGLQGRGYGRNAAVVLPAAGEPVLVVGSFEEEIARERGALEQLRTFPDYVVPTVSCAATVIEELGGSRGVVGVESGTLTYRNRQILAQRMPAAKIVDCSDLLDSVRSIKTPRDEAQMAAIMKALRGAVAEVLPGLAPGTSEWDVHVRLYANIQRRLWTERIDGAVVSGPRLAASSAQASRRAIEKGDLLRITYTCSTAGDTGALSVLASMGEPSRDAERAFARYASAQGDLRDGLRPGMTGEEAYELGRRCLAERGLAQAGNTVGNSLGIATVERPYLSAGEEMTLQPGMVLYLAPETEEGYMASQVVVVQPGGSRNLAGGEVQEGILVAGPGPSRTYL